VNFKKYMIAGFRLEWFGSRWAGSAHGYGYFQLYVWQWKNVAMWIRQCTREVLSSYEFPPFHVLHIPLATTKGVLHV
jgi:hypothetical protein